MTANERIMIKKDPRDNTVGILYPGEMGTSFGKLLREAGFRVVTTTEGRSSRTQRLCQEGGLRVLASFGDVLEHADIVLSLVSPGAALPLAERVAEHRERLSKRLLYIDANSISPMTATQISEVLRPVPIDFVDASIFGLASQLRVRGTLYLSGSRANEVAAEFAPLLRVRAVGDLAGQASALKMIVSGIPKGLSGLFVETMLFAHEMHLLDEAIEACDEIYPNIMEVVKRMLPTYPLHARRRCEELLAVEETMLMSGLKPRIVPAVRAVTCDLAKADWSSNDHDLRQWTISEIIEQMHQNRALQTPELQSSNIRSGHATGRR
jgi:3-hydroxyisobutyrate dehydrogenase-like beta-hydroxyacid dehydrogenase